LGGGNVTLFPGPKYARRKHSFLHGPLDLEELAQVARLGGAALEVWLLIHYRKRLTGDPWVWIPGKDLQRFGVSRLVFYRALKALESAGLIRTQRVPGRSTMILLVRED
jgi:hypothetical protein